LPLNARYAIGNFVKDFIQGGPVIVKSNGTALRTWLYAADMAVWLLKILVSGKSGYPYNVGSDEIISIADAAHQVAQMADPPLQVVILKKTVESQSPKRYVPDVERAKQELNLRVNVAFQEALKKMLDWYKKN